ncbi:MAG: hypothetical protein AAF618_00810 [Pseudomonadota bacterium]
MATQHLDLDALERDLSLPARLNLLADIGGEEVYVPVPQKVTGSALSQRVGPEVAFWLARTYGGSTVRVPSPRQEGRAERHAALVAEVLEDLENGRVLSANEIARKHRVGAPWVRMLRRRYAEGGGKALPPKPRQLSLFDGRERK